MATCNWTEWTFFEHPALGSSLVFQAEVILFETCKPPSAVSLGIFAAASASAAAADDDEDDDDELDVFP
ncbi:hypothetical protein ACTXT7_017233 [Hymenolepis weldensis]